MSVVRLRVPPTFVLPPLQDLGGGLVTVPAPATTGTSVVVDTEQLVLARWGVRLTHDGTGWTLRVPPHPVGVTEVPVAHTMKASARTIPALAVHATRHLRGGRDLARVARLQVRRRAVGVVRDGDVVVHVSDEEVSVHTGRRLSGRFREVVLQPGPAGDQDAVALVEQRLREAGALERDTVAREVRILGPGAVAEPDLPTAPDGDGADVAWHGALVAALRDLLVVGMHLRLDETGRAATASLDHLDRLGGLLELLDADPGATTGIDTLRALVDEVSVLDDRRALLGPDLPSLAEAADEALRAARGRLHDHLDGEDHARSVAMLRELALAPGIAADEAAGTTRASVAARVGKRWSALEHALEDGTPSEAASLAALAAGAAVADGKAPARFARAATRAARAAREHVRAERVQDWCAERAGTLDPAEAYRAGHLAGRRADDAATAVVAWDAALERLRRDKARTWLQ